jgi:hypothetical protein
MLKGLWEAMGGRRNRYAGAEKSFRAAKSLSFAFLERNQMSACFGPFFLFLRLENDPVEHCARLEADAGSVEQAQGQKLPGKTIASLFLGVGIGGG